MTADRYARQSFLGADAEQRIARSVIGIPGLGGGGSHVAQQLAHVGFQNYVLYDDDTVEESNLNRLIGARAVDVKFKTPKLHIAQTLIYGLQPQARILPVARKWQQEPEHLRGCHIVIGCVDSYRGRQELEIASRRYLMHYIDIGMDVHGTERPAIGGQVILSSPGGPCMRCMGFLTEEKLAKEAARYGDAGGHPQVVWPNGALASTAVGLAVDLVTNWTRAPRTHAYLVYDGNAGTIKESFTLRNFKFTGCPHFPDADIGDPVETEL